MASAASELVVLIFLGRPRVGAHHLESLAGFRRRAVPQVSPAFGRFGRAEPDAPLVVDGRRRDVIEAFGAHWSGASGNLAVVGAVERAVARFQQFGVGVDLCSVPPTR